MVHVRDSAVDMSVHSGNEHVTVVAVSVIPVYCAGYINSFESCGAAELNRASQRFLFKSRKKNVVFSDFYIQGGA
jgi:hypothetical protein